MKNRIESLESKLENGLTLIHPENKSLDFFHGFQTLHRKDNFHIL